MKLYYSPGDCSLSPHIIALEAGVACELVRVSLQNHTLDDGSDFRAINPLGYVPYLDLGDGQTLHEGAVIAQYLADWAPEKQLMPTAGTFARWKVLEWLNFIATELHKSYSPLYAASTPDDYKPVVRARLRQRYEWVEQQLTGDDYLLGSQFCVADAYLFTTLNWARHAGIDLSGLHKLQAYHQRVARRPAVQAAMQAERLTFLSI
jgi:glutathione S-transferase